MKIATTILSIPFYLLCGTGWVGIAIYFTSPTATQMRSPTQSVLIDIALAIVGHIGIAVCRAIDAKRHRTQSSPRI